MLSAGDDSVTTRLRKVYLRSFAFIGLSVVAGCYTPIVLSHYHITEAMAWRLSSLLFLALWVVGLFTNLKHAPSTKELIKQQPMAFSMSALLVFGGWGLLAWNVTSPGQNALAIHVTAMLFSLIIGARFFYANTFTFGETSMQDR